MHEKNATIMRAIKCVIWALNSTLYDCLFLDIDQSSDCCSYAHSIWNQFSYCFYQRLMFLSFFFVLFNFFFGMREFVCMNASSLFTFLSFFNYCLFIGGLVVSLNYFYYILLLCILTFLRQFLTACWLN